MKTFATLIVALSVSLAVASLAYSRDIKHLFPIAAAMGTKDAQAKLDHSMKVYFGKQPIPHVLKNLRNSAARGKADIKGKGSSLEQACNSAFLPALVALQKRARQLGANAVVNIVSYYKRVEMSSTTQFECHEGTLTVGVELKGDFVKIADK